MNSTNTHWVLWRNCVSCVLILSIPNNFLGKPRFSYFTFIHKESLNFLFFIYTPFGFLFTTCLGQCYSTLTLWGDKSHTKCLGWNELISKQLLEWSITVSNTNRCQLPSLELGNIYVASQDKALVSILISVLLCIYMVKQNKTRPMTFL